LAKNKRNIEQLDKRYLVAILESLEEKRQQKNVDEATYEELKKKYQLATERATIEGNLREGFVTFEVITPQLETIQLTVQKFANHIKKMNNEKEKISERFAKLDQLLKEERISEETYSQKKREYEILLIKIDEEKGKFIEKMPEVITKLHQAQISLNQQLEEAQVKVEIENGNQEELKEREETLEEVEEAIETVVAMAKEEGVELKGIKKRPPRKIVKAKITPLSKEHQFPTQEKTVEQGTSIPLPRDSLRREAIWKDMTIGQLIGELKVVNGHYAVILTDRPSLDIIRTLGVVGPARLRGLANPKAIEDRLEQEIVKEYNVDSTEALLPRNLIKYCFEKKLGIDLLKLINSYYATVGKGAIRLQGTNSIIVNKHANVLSLAENVGLLGRRVLAPDKSLIGVVHELYLDPDRIQLYTLTFKGVPPPVIREIYRKTHPERLSERTFGAFRNEISQKLTIPIYEALTPSSILRYCLMEGLIKDFNQLVTMTEKMNPRISKAQDITSISSQGLILSRFPQNSLPEIVPPKWE
jgi:hypothetical protein